jgi:hypothetical protein
VSKPSRVVLFLGALALICALMGLLGMHSGSRGAFRTYEAELKAKGEKLTYEALMRGRATNAADSHAVITNAAARLRSVRLNPGLLDLRKYVRPGQAMVVWRQTSPVWGQSNGPVGEGKWDELAAQIQPLQDTLQEVREALKAPAPDGGPFINMLLTRRVDFVAIRTAAQWLMGAAENDLHQGRLEAALQNLEALTGLARMERDEPTLVAQMIRVAVANLGLAVTWEALQAPGWTEPQLERMQSAWQAVDLVDAVERGFVGERTGRYEMFALTRHSSGSRMGRFLRGSWSTGPASASKAGFEDLVMEHLYIPLYKLTSIDQDELFYLRNMQEGIMALRLLKAHRPWAEAKQRLNQVATNVNTIARSPQRLRYLFSLMGIPNWTRACETAVHGETERQMTLAAIALRRFQLRHGQLPPSLEALVPEFLPAVPYDYMSAKPLGYRLQADGSYVLYSVGEDAKDDGGNPSPAPGGLNGLWTGRDAVWPSPASAPGGT